VLLVYKSRDGAVRLCPMFIEASLHGTIIDSALLVLSLIIT